MKAKLNKAIKKHRSGKEETKEQAKETATKPANEPAATKEPSPTKEPLSSKVGKYLNKKKKPSSKQAEEKK